MAEWADTGQRNQATWASDIAPISAEDKSGIPGRGTLLESGHGHPGEVSRPDG